MRLRHALCPLLVAAATLCAQTRNATDAADLALPVPGSRTLRILSPTLLEVTVVTEKSPEAGVPAAPEAALRSLEVAVDGRSAAVEATGWKRRAAYAPIAHRDLRVATELYLRLANPIGESAVAPTVSVRDASVSPRGPLPGPPLEARMDPLRASPAIHVNQEGYVPTLPKKAFVGYYLGDLGEMPVPADAGFSLVDARDGRVVYQGRLERRPEAGGGSSPPSYQQVYAADFSAFSTPGEYRVAVPGLGASLPFLINEGIAMGFARTYALGIYGQRCGFAMKLPYTRFVHDACHVSPAQVPSPQEDPQFAFTWSKIASYAGGPSPDNPPQTAPVLSGESAQLFPFSRKGPIDVAGGHHDAGDYSKYTTNSAELLHYLVFALDNVPGLDRADNLGTPESGDGIPDVLQEAKWESDFLAKMQDSDGGFYFLVYPKGREYESDVLPEDGDAQVVWPKNTSVTAGAVAALAQCSSSPAFRKYYPKAAADYLRRARLGWEFLSRAIFRYGKEGSYQKITFYGDHFRADDELAWAACELFLATGEAAFRDQLRAWFPNPSDPATYRWGWWRMSESWGNAVRSYAFAARSGRMPRERLDPLYLAACEREIAGAADDALRWSRESAYATPFPGPTKRAHGGGWYFSLDQASDMAVASLIDPRPAYLDALVGAMNYEGGGNPANVAFITGLGVRRELEIVSQYAQNDRRSLPPSGIPVGNIQAGYSYSSTYGVELRDLAHPSDGAAEGAYPVYDRWSDTFNVTTEFITVNQARGFLSSIVLAAGTPAFARQWKAVPAEIVGEPGAPLRLEVKGMDLADARIVWESRGREPAFGQTFTLADATNGDRWVESEAEWPDGRRAFAARTFAPGTAEFTWFSDSLPQGATAETNGGSWEWSASDPAPRSGRLAHRSGSAGGGLGEHWFTGASQRLSVAAVNSLFAWVYLDASSPPSELMLMWHDAGGWEHRAFWGADVITYGKDNSAGRFHEGGLPAPGRWVKLIVAADSVGLQRADVDGMGFAQVGGRATWGAAGLTPTAR